MRSPNGSEHRRTGGTGDGWTTCDLGHRHWGRFGAAGLLLRRNGAPDADLVLQLRVDWSHHGGTWGVPGGARDEDETPIAAALREANEEASITSDAVRIEASYVDDHGGWSYTTVLATAVGRPLVRARGPESTQVRWVGAADSHRLPLHPGFARTWPLLQPVAPSASLLVDAANVMGARPDGWWRDRRAAAVRLRDDLAVLARDGWPDRVWPAPFRYKRAQDRTGVASLRRLPAVIMVVEGQARGVESLDPTADGSVGAVQVVDAAGSGDDTLVELATEHAERPGGCAVITADRELAARVRRVGAAVAGPRVLLERFGVDRSAGDADPAVGR